MFCFQCEQTARGLGCTTCGVCGKSATVADAQDALTATMIALATALPEDELLSEISLFEGGLFTTITNVSFDVDTTQALQRALLSLAKNIPLPQHDDLATLWTTQEDIRSLKSLVLFGLRGMAAYAYHARTLGFSDPTIGRFILKALRAIKGENAIKPLLDLALELGRVNLSCMELLDRANTLTYGDPTPTEVSMFVKPGPFIVVTGHDLHDLADLLPQAAARGVDVYTHGEMLPAHGYPKLHAYQNLRGNFGTAWQNQQREFDHLPGAILFTTNCLMPPRTSYIDRVFTTAVVHYPNVPSIPFKDGKKDFTPLIERAIALGGYPMGYQGQGINGGTTLTTGFAHHAILSHADEILAAIQKGDIKHIYLVGGCDGARTGRNAFTEFVKNTPKDSLVLTLACGKFRFNDLDLGKIGPFPRLMDMGQCNDAYSAIVVATTLAKACKCSVNQLPLTLILSWYEQKAVCILLTLLALGIHSIRLGPTLPAFLSPKILNALIEHYDIRLFPGNCD